MRPELLQIAELDGIGRTRLGAGRLQAVFETVVAERALVRLVIATLRRGVELDHAIGTRRHAVSAPVANVLLNDNRVEFGADDGAGGTRFEAAGMSAMLAHVAHHHPGGLTACPSGARQR